jgi:hypothetical protein
LYLSKNADLNWIKHTYFKKKRNEIYLIPIFTP